jgi:hypothetical protein
MHITLKPGLTALCREAPIFGIKNFWLFNPKSEELLLSLFCPRLERIRLDFIFQGKLCLFNNDDF